MDQPSCRSSRSPLCDEQGSGCGSRQTAEAALARVEVGDAGAQMRGAEVRPHRVGENELGVGALPEQKIREPLLAAGADQEIDVAAGAVTEPRQQTREGAALGR